MARMRTIGTSLDKGYRDDLNYNFGLLEALIGEAKELTGALREEILAQINNLQQQIDMLTGENIGELLARLNDSIQQALTAAQDARTATTATEQATALTKTATELANASATLAEEKANYAEGKAILAQEAADNANQEASNLSQLKIDVVQATQDANTATNNSNQATQAAQTATNTINVVLPNVTGLVNLKEWSIDTQYKKNNFVTLEGNGYMALRDNKGVKPPSLPVLSNVDWAMFVQKGEKGEQGTGVKILGTLGDESALPPTGEPGDAYMIGEFGNLYVWQANEGIWQNVGPIKGPKGDTGPQGPEGPEGPPGQDADLTEVNQEIANLQQEVTDNKEEVTAHLAEIATTEKLGHIKPDGKTIMVDHITGLASAIVGYQLTNGEYAKDCEGVDLNTLLDTGIYTAKGGHVALNYPLNFSTSYHTLVIVNKANDGWVYQTWIYATPSENVIYMRGSVLGTWNKWTRLDVTLNDTLTSTSTTQGATANAVKQINDKLIDSKVAIGADTTAIGSYSTALGYQATSTANYSVALGSWAVSTNAQEAVLGIASGSTGTNRVRVPGSLSVTGTKQFEMPHPKLEKRYTHVIRHGAVESPTAGDTLYRYTVNVEGDKAQVKIIGIVDTIELEIRKNGEGLEISIPLPDYWIYLNINEQVFVSPFMHFGVGHGYINREKETLELVLQYAKSYNVALYGTRNDGHESVQSWHITGAEREIGESWLGETYTFEVEEITEVTEFEEVLQ